jgi:glutaredoxin
LGVMALVVVHALRGCPYSERAVHSLKHVPWLSQPADVDVRWVDPSEKDAYRRQQEWAPGTTFPQIYWRGRPLGGWDRWHALLRVVKACRKHGVPLDVVRALVQGPAGKARAKARKRS